MSRRLSIVSKPKRKMTEMIERVARSLAGRRFACDQEGPIPCDICGDEDGCVTLARAAIAAMREPTEGMVKGGRNTADCDVNVFASYYSDTIAFWRRMIDAALKD